MSFKKSLGRMDAAIFKRGEKAIYNGRCLVQVIIDKDVEQFGAFETKGPARRHEASFLGVDIPNPKRGQTIQCEDATYEIDGIISNDGSVIKVHINES